MRGSEVFTIATLGAKPRNTAHHRYRCSAQDKRRMPAFAHESSHRPKSCEPRLRKAAEASGDVQLSAGPCASAAVTSDFGVL